MGCTSSSATVRPLTPEEVKGDQDETGSRVYGRGDSAVSKDTTDSGVVMENRDNPVLPGTVPRKLPPLTSERVRESDTDRIIQNGFLLQESTAQERPKSSEILEELLNQGIIPVRQTREKCSGTGEAYSIMLDDGEAVRRRPPARLESLKAKKAQNFHSKEEIEEKMRLAEERRKLREDELKKSLRTKSARARRPAPISSTEEDKDTVLNPVEQQQSLITPKPLDPLPCCPSEVAEGGEQVKARGDGREVPGRADTEEQRVKRDSGDNRGEGAEGVSDDGDRKEVLTQEEELRKDQLLLTASGELESDSSFQHAEEKEEIF